MLSRMVPSGQVGPGHRRHNAHGGGGPAHLAPGLEQPGLGLQQRRGGVDLVALGPEPARSVGPAQTLGRVVQLGCRDQEGLGQGQVRGALGHRDPLVWRGEADTVELAVHLGQDVGPGEGGPALGHALDRHAGGVGQDLIGQVAGVQEGQIVAIGQPGHPGVRLVSDVPLGSSSPPSRQLTQAVMLLGRPGLQGRSLAQLEHLHIGRLAPMGGGELVRPTPSCAPR